MRITIQDNEGKIHSGYFFRDAIEYKENEK